MLKKIKSRAVTFALSAALATGLISAPDDARAQADPLLGQIMIVGFNFCPRGWANANGALLAISSNTALFSLLGTTYGGDGRTTFGLPDLRSRSVIGGNMGQGPGLDTISWGQKGGTPTQVLTTLQMPSHNHALNASNQAADQKKPNGDFLGWPDVMINNEPLDIYSNTNTPDATMHAGSIGNTGGSQAFNIRDPYLGMQICIALQGVYPSRN